MPTAAELAADYQERGLADFRAERLDAAAAAFAEAARLFAEAAEPGAAAEMRNNLGVVRLAQHRWDEALAAVTGTPEVFRAQGDALREAQAVANLAAAYDGAGQVEPAAERYVEAIDLFGRLGETDTRAACFKKLGALKLRQGKQLEALGSIHSGLRLSGELSPQEKRLKGLLDKAMTMIGGKT